MVVGWILSPDETKVACHAVPGSLEGIERSDLEGGGLQKMTAKIDEMYFGTHVRVARRDSRRTTILAALVSFSARSCEGVGLKAVSATPFTHLQVR
jgi:hypothetical protein